MDAVAAQARLERMTASAVDPVLDAPALADLMLIAKRPDRTGNDPRNDVAATAWASATLYAPGDLRRQAAGVERWWICLIAGTTASTAPSWPTLTGYARSDTTVTDGTVTWQDAGSRWAPTWNLNAAAGAGWEMKAALVSGRFNFAADQQRFDRSQVHAMCLEQADRYRRRGAGTTVMR